MPGVRTVVISSEDCMPTLLELASLGVFRLFKSIGSTQFAVTEESFAYGRNHERIYQLVKFVKVQPPK